MPIFKIGIDRISYAHREIEVEAENKAEADLKALDQAGNFEFSEHNADYVLADAEDKGTTALRLLRQLIKEIGHRADEGEQGMADLDNCDIILEARKKLKVHK